jgi:putative membrane protein
MAATKLSNDRSSFGRLESMEVEKQSAAFSAKKEYFSEPSVCSRAGKRTNGRPLSVSEMEKAQLASTPEEQPIQLGLRDLNAVKAFMNIPAWADALAERGMHKRRTFYTHDDWLRHRSSTRHARHFLSSLSSRVILSLGPPVGIITLIASVIAAYNSAISTGLLPPYFSLLHASALPYELSAPALALLLVFRTEASYSRYDEARKTWTKVISSTKDLARQSVTWIQEPEDSNQKEFLLRYIEAFPVALKCHLLYGSDTWQELKDILDEDDLALVMCSEHRPNCLIQLMTQSLRQVLLQDSERSLLDANMSQFNDSISVCERLIRTPIPLSYTRLTSRILVLWHLTLPVVLWDDCKLMVIPATFISAACLFCIEEVGVLIEEPFPILPLDRMCAKARENIKELIKLQVQAREHLITKARKKQAARVTIGARDYN